MKKLLLTSLICFISFSVLPQSNQIEEFRVDRHVANSNDLLLMSSDTMTFEEDQNLKLSSNFKNTIYLSIDFIFVFSINYERLFPLSNKVKLGLRGGFGYGGGNKNLAITGEGIFLYGESKHFLEVGVGYHLPFYYFDEGPDSPLIGIITGYRYQNLSGFLIKVYPMFIIELSPDEDSWGYFPSLGFAIGYSF